MDIDISRAFDKLFDQSKEIHGKVTAVATKVEAIEKKMPESKIMDTEACHERMSQCHTDHDAKEAEAKKPWTKVVVGIAIAAGGAIAAVIVAHLSKGM